MSVPPVRTKLSGFVLAGAIAGMAGALYAVLLGAVGFNTFDPSYGLVVFSMAVIGGLGSISGVLMGVALIEVLSFWKPQVPAGVHRVRPAGDPAVPPGRAGGRRAVRSATVCSRWWRNRRADPGAEPGGRQAGRARPTTRPRSRPCSEHALERGGGRRRRGRRCTTGLRARAATADEDTDRGAGGGGAVSGRCRRWGHRRQRLERPRPGHADRALVRQGRGVLRPGADPLRCRPRGARGRDRGPARHERRRQVDAAQGCQRTGQGRRGLGPAGRHRRSTGTRPSRSPARACRSCPVAVASSPRSAVDENLRLGTWMVRKDHRAVAEAKERVLDLFPILRQRAHQQAGNLSGGEQQMLSLSMALMVTPEGPHDRRALAGAGADHREPAAGRW